MFKISLTGLAAVLLLSSCVSEKEKAPLLPEATLERIVPDQVMEGQPFQQQPNGLSAMSVLGANLVRGSRIKLNGMALDTAASDGTSLGALVPPEMYAKAGAYLVSVETPDGRSTNSLTWTVLPKTGPAPEIVSLHPDTTPAGKPFNVQANGVSAMGVVGANFLPGAKVVIDGKEMETSFGKTDQLGAVVATSAFAQPGRYKVTILNPDGKRSAPRDFVVTK